MVRRRKPLEWVSIDGEDIVPDCHRCIDWISQPLMAEAIASVGIERPVDVKRLVEDYHGKGHVDV